MNYRDDGPGATAPGVAAAVELAGAALSVDVLPGLAQPRMAANKSPHASRGVRFVRFPISITFLIG